MESILKEGRLSFDYRLAALLTQIAEEKRPGITTLRLSNFDIGKSGEIVFKKGRIVSGARVKGHHRDQDCDGYQALRLLAGATNADFQFIDQPAKLPDLTLNIELSRVLKLLPGLPDDQSVLQNDELMMNAIFNPNATSDCMPVRPGTDKYGTSTNLKSTKASWNEIPLPVELAVTAAAAQQFQSLETQAIKESASQAIQARQAEEAKRHKESFSYRSRVFLRSAVAIGGNIAPVIIGLVLFGVIAQFGIYIFSNAPTIVPKPDQRVRAQSRTRPRTAVSRRAPERSTEKSTERSNERTTAGSASTITASTKRVDDKDTAGSIPGGASSSQQVHVDTSPTPAPNPTTRRRAYQTY